MKIHIFSCCITLEILFCSDSVPNEPSLISWKNSGLLSITLNQKKKSLLFFCLPPFLIRKIPLARNLLYDLCFLSLFLKEINHNWIFICVQTIGFWFGRAGETAKGKEPPGYTGPYTRSLDLEPAILASRCSDPYLC